MLHGHSFIIHIKTEDYKEKRFDISNYEINRPLHTRENKIVVGLVKDEVDGKTICKVYNQNFC